MKNSKKIQFIFSAAAAVITGAMPLRALAEDITSGPRQPGSAYTDAQKQSEEAEKTAPTAFYENVSTATEEDVEAFKKQVIQHYIDTSPVISADDVDFAASSISTENVNYAQNTLQRTIIHADIVLKDEAASKLPDKSDTDSSQPNTISYTENAAVHIQNDLADKSAVSLKQSEVTVYQGNSFSYESNINQVLSSNSILPAITETDNIDTSQTGTYSVNIKTVDQTGRENNASYTVNVVKSPEQEAAESSNTDIQQADAQNAADEAAAGTDTATVQTAEAPAAETQQAQAASETPAEQTQTQAATQSGSGAQIVSIARSWVGVGRYVWGGTDPASGTDCSGFTQYVYAQVGINLNRTAAAQAANGVPVSAAQAQPGDLVLWSGHAGIYAGNGMMINAMNPYDGICEVAVNAFYGAGTFLGYYHVPGVN